MIGWFRFLILKLSGPQEHYWWPKCYLDLWAVPHYRSEWFWCKLVKWFRLFCVFFSKVHRMEGLAWISSNIVCFERLLAAANSFPTPTKPQLYTYIITYIMFLLNTVQNKNNSWLCFRLHSTRNPRIVGWTFGVSALRSWWISPLLWWQEDPGFRTIKKIDAYCRKASRMPFLDPSSLFFLEMFQV